MAAFNCTWMVMRQLRDCWVEVAKMLESILQININKERAEGNNFYETREIYLYLKGK